MYKKDESSLKQTYSDLVRRFSRSKFICGPYTVSNAERTRLYKACMNIQLIRIQLNHGASLGCLSNLLIVIVSITISLGVSVY